MSEDKKCFNKIDVSATRENLRKLQEIIEPIASSCMERIMEQALATLSVGQTVIAPKDIYQDIDGRPLLVWGCGRLGTVRKINADGSLLIEDYSDDSWKYCAEGIRPEEVEVIPDDWTTEQIMDRSVYHLMMRAADNIYERMQLEKRIKNKRRRARK